jgi:hypothetical protein
MKRHRGRPLHKRYGHAAGRSFGRWLDTFLSEKGIDLEQGFVVRGPSGDNHMTYENVVDVMKQAPAHEQAAIKNMIVRIDFKNGDVCHYLRHLAQAIAQ